MKFEKAKEQFKSFLKLGSHRITPERFEVLEHALEFKGHFGADDLFVEMKKQNSNISRATIYNTLELLSLCELIAKRNFGDGKTRYESSFNKKNHDHLICTNCGSIKEFQASEIQNLVDKICDDLGFDTTGYSFNIFGNCHNRDNCRNRRNG